MQNLSVGSDAAVKLRAGERMNVSGQGNRPVVVDTDRDSGGLRGAWPEQRTAEKSATSRKAVASCWRKNP